MAHHDVIIVGTGSGRLALSPALADLDIAFVEHGRFGGTCLNVGCIPTKMFVLPADRIVEARESAKLGVDFAPPAIDWPTIRDRILGTIDPKAVAAMDRLSEARTVYRHTASFVGDKRLALSDGTELTADQIVIAAGSRPQMLPVAGLDHPDPDAGVHTSDSIMRLDMLPARMVIIGGGFVACEFAHIFEALGVDLTVIEALPTLLPAEEDTVSQVVTEAFAKRMTVKTSSKVTAAERRDGVWQLIVDGPDGGDTIAAEVVLVATGRVPNGDRLQVNQAGIDLDDQGRVVVDEYHRTTAPGVWALGDISTHWPLKHVANHEGRTVAHNLAIAMGRASGEMRSSDYRVVPHAVFTHPQVASFGPTSRQLDEAGIAYVSATQPYSTIAYGWALEDTEHSLTVHADPTSRQILAAHCVGPQATLMIQPLIQAASLGIPADEVARGQYWPHPGLSELVENALLNLAFND